MQVLCWISGCKPLPVIPGLRVVKDWFVRAQTTIRTYNRVREYVNPHSGTKVFLQYDPCAPWLAAVKVTFCPDDRYGLLRDELESFLSSFQKYRLLTVEISFDFTPESGVDEEFVQRHALFGKSRPRNAEGSGGRLTLGTRKSTKFVRCYQKAELEVYRVELQLHSEWLRVRRIRKLQDLAMLPRLIFPKHFKFVRVDWNSVSTSMLHRGTRHLGKIHEAKRQASSIHGVVRYLGNDVGLVNPYRFLRTMKITGQVRRHFRRWIRQWCDRTNTLC